MSRIDELREEIRELEREEQSKKDQEKAQKLYEQFKQRPSDWVIGRAHCEPHFNSEGRSYETRDADIPFSVTINGNSTATYKPKAWVTKSTNTFFRNVLTDKQECELQERLTAVVEEFIRPLQKDLHFVLDIMGLQNDHYWLNNYPEDKREDVKAEVELEQDKVLEPFTKEDWTNCPRLSHGGSIAARFLSRHHHDWLSDFSHRKAPYV